MSEPISQQPNALLGLSNSLANAVATAGAAVVAINGRQRMPSSGVHWRQGLIVTADHTLERDDDLSITTADGTTIPATLVGRDPSTDIAVLKIADNGLAVATVSTDSLQIGHLVLAIGRPGGISASFGVVSTVSGEWHTQRGGVIDQLIHADITMYPGFSGGPLVNASGAVVGINTSHLTRAFDVAIPVSTVNKVVDQLVARGHIARGYLGVLMQPIHIQESQRDALKLEQHTAVIIIGVEQGGPAEKAGLFVGDILIGLNDHTITDTNDIQSHLTGDTIGNTMNLQIIRGGTRTTVPATVGERSQKES